MRLMDWNRCTREFVQKVEVDNERIKSLIETAKKRIKFIERDVDVDSVSFVVEGYYEAIKELLTAYMLSKGFKSKNHQCLITFFYKENKDYEFEVNLISQLCYFRNRLNYYGEKVPIDFYSRNKKEIQNIISILIDKISYPR